MILRIITLPFLLLLFFCHYWLSLPLLLLLSLPVLSTLTLLVLTYCFQYQHHHYSKSCSWCCYYHYYHHIISIISIMIIIIIITMVIIMIRNNSRTAHPPCLIWSGVGVLFLNGFQVHVLCFNWSRLNLLHICWAFSLLCFTRSHNPSQPISEFIMWAVILWTKLINIYILSTFAMYDQTVQSVSNWHRHSYLIHHRNLLKIRLYQQKWLLKP